MSDQEDKYYLKEEKLNELKEEREYLLEEKKPEVADKIHEAKQLGDLSENASYKAAKQEMRATMSRIDELKEIIDNAEIIEEKEGADEIQLGTTFIVKTDNGQKEYELVGSREADPLNGKISKQSPLGSGFVGAEEGEEVDIETPGGVQTYKIIEIK
ncbi:MAG: transcription elongation factor GreA [Candidatus Magasanikbacteria bacterium]